MEAEVESVMADVGSVGTPSVGDSPDHLGALLNNPANLFNRIGLPSDASERVTLPTEIIHRPTARKGRTPGKTVPFTERVLIGVNARLVGTSQAAREGGVTVSTADGYKDGSTEQGKRGARPDPQLKAAVEGAIGKAKNMAVERILGAIQSIEIKADGKIRGLDADKPMQSAILASTLSGVVDKLTPKDNNSDNRVQIIVYGPSEREEAEYERIEVPAIPEQR